MDNRVKCVRPWASTSVVSGNISSGLHPAAAPLYVSFTTKKNRSIYHRISKMNRILKNI